MPNNTFKPTTNYFIEIMTRLTNHQIGFIDKYLKNSGIEYLDIRYEMTDHIAAALEEEAGDFYENFTAYMIKHKKGLLASNKKFARLSRNRAIAILLRTVVNPMFLLAWAILSCVSYLLAKSVDYETSSGVLRTVYGLALVAAFVSLIYSYFIKREKSYSVADKLLTIVIIAVYLLLNVFKVERFIENQTALLIYYSFLACFAGSGYISFRQLKDNYKMQYDG